MWLMRFPWLRWKGWIYGKKPWGSYKLQAAVAIPTCRKKSSVHTFNAIKYLCVNIDLLIQIGKILMQRSLSYTAIQYTFYMTLLFKTYEELVYSLHWIYGSEFRTVAKCTKASHPLVYCPVTRKWLVWHRAVGM